MDRQFLGKVVVISGASQGLGAAAARLMAERGAAGLFLVGRSQERGSQVAESISNRWDCDARFLSADLSDAAAPQQVIAGADAAFGRIDALLNVAASTVRGSVWDTDAAMWDEMLAVNTRAPALLISGAAQIMKRSGIEGSIVNIGSVAARGGQDFLYPYSASKEALVAITRNAAHALMRHRIRVNLLQPGWMNTEGEDATQRRFHNAEDGWLEEASAKLPFGRLIDPNEVARAMCFLASEESGMMTGTVIDFDQSVIGAGDASVPGLNPVWGES